ncbi:hypothetical protein HAX54_030963 [Datura stramonium]|uniref:Uncharacterized protein n=1 Tax=Datura stramonium TaxID=4076 RepID=A0ABS8V975_DATST|nr:hypothetical protein [Datura stramonium]
MVFWVEQIHHRWAVTLLERGMKERKEKKVVAGWDFGFGYAGWEKRKRGEVGGDWRLGRCGRLLGIRCGASGAVGFPVVMVGREERNDDVHRDVMPEMREKGGAVAREGRRGREERVVAGEEGYDGLRAEGLVVSPQWSGEFLMVAEEREGKSIEKREARQPCHDA